LKRVIVPPTPGVLAAYGGLIADIRNDFIRTAFVDLDAAGLATLESHAAELEARALTWLRDEQQFGGEARLIWSADMRYLGQSYEIETVINRADLTNGALLPIAEAFHAEHSRVYDHSDPAAPVQVVNLRLVIRGSAPKPALSETPQTPGPASADAETTIFLDGATHTTPIYARAGLAPGQAFAGPAIVTQDDCTTIVPPGHQVTVDGWGNLLIAAED
ncbi:MAG: hydantoinase/oxoprolinase family protein, partial [Pseudomonadota bacterium]